ncbi:MFS transporter [Tistrella bauzanensis]|uniref:MFS transporter n=1 Tax=Tistrella arctica TaxID=3133430 RepID=A0ABU9YIN7_9PROT
MTTTGGDWAEIRRGGRFGAFMVLCLGIWLHAADSLLTTTVMPAVTAEIGGIAWVNWALALYELGSIVAGACTGLAVRAAGLGRATTLAAAAFAVGCVISALAPDMGTLLAGRLVQGVGGGTLVALAHVSVARLYEPRLWPRLYAIMSGLWGASALAGPMIGGLFADAGLWRGAFWAFGAQALVVAVAGGLLLNRVGIAAMDAAERGDAHGMPAARVPFGRLALLIIAVLAVAAAGVSGAITTAALLGLAGVALLAVFFRVDGRQPLGRGLFPPAALNLRHRQGMGLMMVLTLSAGTVPFTVYGPILFVVLHGTDALTAGFLVAIEAVAWTIASVLLSGAGPRAERWLIRAGAVVILGGIAGFAIVIPHGSLWMVIPFAAAQGAGFGMCWAFIVRRIVGAVPDDARESASSAVPTMQILGYALGAAAAGIAANLSGLGGGHGGALPDPETAARVGFWVFAAFLPIGLVGVIAAFRLARGPARSASLT